MCILKLTYTYIYIHIYIYICFSFFIIYKRISTGGSGPIQADVEENPQIRRGVGTQLADSHSAHVPEPEEDTPKPGGGLPIGNTWVWLKKPEFQNGTLVSGQMDQNLRNPSSLILSHCRMENRPKGDRNTWKTSRQHAGKVQ